MKIVAIILNIVLLTLIFWLFSEQGVLGEVRYVVIFMILIVCPVVNIIAFFYDGWLGLYFKRKALEEKKKIEALTADDDTKPKDE